MKITRIDAIQKKPLELLRGLRGHYKCPRGPNGEALGPLVGYAGRDLATGQQSAGYEYVNFAKAEPYRFVFDEWAVRMADGLRSLKPTVAMGMPMGGIMVADSIGRALNCRVVYPEKKILALANETSREKSKLVWGRHQLDPGNRVIIAEDVLNNFSTTGEALALVSDAGAEVVAIAGFLNRSLDQRQQFEDIPVVSLILTPIAEYRQEDPEVAAEIEKGNVAWKPKDEWDRLEAAMLAHPEPEQT